MMTPKMYHNGRRHHTVANRMTATAPPVLLAQADEPVSISDANANESPVLPRMRALTESLPPPSLLSSRLFAVLPLGIFEEYRLISSRRRTPGRSESTSPLLPALHRLYLLLRRLLPAMPVSMVVVGISLGV
mmetsp:Transcript_14070/g.34073  ORF Transcript_14070/g.34073 Transcript_14070/m.34073 type:complete len:132 (+) Transcript_14070:109-504(+)